MHSINTYWIQQRIAHVYDTAHGAQATSKGIKEYVGKLEKAAGIKRAGGRSADEFLRDIGGGI